MKHFYEKADWLLNQPTNVTFEEVLWMTKDEFRDWCIQLRKDVVNYSPFTMIAHKAPYSKSYPTVVNGEKIDDIYEGKAFDWLVSNREIDIRKNKTLFWVVGSRPQNVDYIIGNNL